MQRDTQTHKRGGSLLIHRTADHPVFRVTHNGTHTRQNWIIRTTVLKSVPSSQTWVFRLSFSCILTVRTSLRREHKVCAVAVQIQSTRKEHSSVKQTSTTCIIIFFFSSCSLFWELKSFKKNWQVDCGAFVQAQEQPLGLAWRTKVGRDIKVGATTPCTTWRSWCPK